MRAGPPPSPRSACSTRSGRRWTRSRRREPSGAASFTPRAREPALTRLARRAALRTRVAWARTRVAFRPHSAPCSRRRHAPCTGRSAPRRPVRSSPCILALALAALAGRRCSCSCSCCSAVRRANPPLAPVRGPGRAPRPEPRRGARRLRGRGGRQAARAAHGSRARHASSAARRSAPSTTRRPALALELRVRATTARSSWTSRARASRWRALAAGAAVPGTLLGEARRDAHRRRREASSTSTGRKGCSSRATGRAIRTRASSIAAANVAGALRVTAIEQCTSGERLQRALHARLRRAAGSSSVLDRAGRRAEFGWDASGRLVSARDALDVAKGWPGFRYRLHRHAAGLAHEQRGRAHRLRVRAARLASATAGGAGLARARASSTRAVTAQASITPASGTRSARSAATPTTRSAACSSGARSRPLSDDVGLERRTVRRPYAAERRDHGVDLAGRRRTAPHGSVRKQRDFLVSAERRGPRESAHASRGADRRLTRRGRDAQLRRGGAAGRAEQRCGRRDALQLGAGRARERDEPGITRSFSQYGEHGHAERVTAFGHDRAARLRRGREPRAGLGRRASRRRRRRAARVRCGSQPRGGHAPAARRAAPRSRRSARAPQRRPARARAPRRRRPRVRATTRSGAWSSSASARAALARHALRLRRRRVGRASSNDRTGCARS